MSEFPHAPSSFEQLEQEVSSELLKDDAVFGLVSDTLEFDTPNPSLQTDFTVRPYYGGRLSAELADDAADSARYIPISLQISESGSRSDSDVPELSMKLATFKYLKIGAMSTDGSDLRIFDEAGRLHQVDKDERGMFLAGKDAPFDLRRAEAFPAWQRAHNAMIRAARDNPAMRLDSREGVWTDQPARSYSIAPEEKN